MAVLLIPTWLAQLDSANLQVGVDFAAFSFACTNPTEFLD
jgi:hypothetical protein